MQVMAKGLAPSTKAQYKSGLRAFLVFCTAQRVPHHLRLPADEFLLCSFATSCAGLFLRQSTQNALSAVRAWHITQNATWHGALQLKYVMGGVAKEALPPQPLRPPITRAMLESLHRGLGQQPLGTCVLAAALVAFWTQLCLGELLSTHAGLFDPKTVPLRCHLNLPTMARGSQSLHLPWTKTTRSCGDSVLILQQDGACDPIAVLDTHLTTNNPP